MKNNRVDKVIARALAYRPPPMPPSMPPPNKGGAPKGNRNAIKHGRYTAAMRALRAMVRARLNSARAAIMACDRDRASSKMTRP